MENKDKFNEYSIKLNAFGNNRKSNERVNPEHIMSEEQLKKLYISYMPFLENILLNENEALDKMGEIDLINYEKWLK